MKTLQVNNYKNFVRKAAIKYSTTCQQIQDIAEELECTVFCQTKKMYNNPYNYYLISQEDIYRICTELEARKDNLAQPKEAKKRSCKEDKLEWLINQGATVDVTDKPNVYMVSMYNGAIVKKFNLSCGMQNIQNYFDRCFSKHKDSDYDENGKLILKSERQADKDMSVTPEEQGRNNDDDSYRDIGKGKREKNNSKTTLVLPSTTTATTTYPSTLPSTSSTVKGKPTKDNFLLQDGELAEIREQFRKEREANKAKNNQQSNQQKKVISIGSMDENGVHTIEADLTADEFLEYADSLVAE